MELDPYIGSIPRQRLCRLWVVPLHMYLSYNLNPIETHMIQEQQVHHIAAMG